MHTLHHAVRHPRRAPTAPTECTYGTGASPLTNTGASRPASTHGLIPTLGYRFGDAPERAVRDRENWGRAVDRSYGWAR